MLLWHPDSVLLSAGARHSSSSSTAPAVNRPPERGSPGAATLRSGGGADNGNGEAGVDSGGALSSANIDAVDVRLEHNTLLVMWPPTQEEWRHEVWDVPCSHTRITASGRPCCPARVLPVG